MTKYAYDKYGNFIYGEANPNVNPYYQSSITAESVDYNSIRILWNPINPDPTIGTPTYWALVKTFSGKPDDPYDGRIVVADSMDRFMTAWLEEYVTTSDREVNYSIWVFTPDYGWSFCGSVNAIIIGQTNTKDIVSKWLPRAWQNDKEGIGDSVGEYELQDLMTAISAYSVEYDRLRTSLKILEKLNTSKYITNDYAATKLLDFGFKYEPNLGDPYYRTLAISGDNINSLKGTTEGISRYITALTHIQNKVEIGHNLFLDYNDSSFEESVGRWGATTGSIVHTTYEAEGITPPSPNIYDIESTPRSVGLGLIEATYGFEVTCPNLPEVFLLGTIINGYAQMIPVTPGNRYIFTGWARAASSSSINAVIVWYNQKGQIISDTPVNDTALTANTWVEFKSASDSYRNGQVAPAGARFAKLVLTPTINPITEYYFATPDIYLDMFQFCEWQYSLSYEDPRLIKIYLRGEEENLLPNPYFGEGIGGWFASQALLSHDNGMLGIETLAPETEELPLTLYTGPVVWSDWMEVDPGISYTFSINKDDAYNDRLILGIEFTNAKTKEGQSAVRLLGDAFYYDSFEYVDKYKLSTISYDPEYSEIIFETVDMITFDAFEVGDSVTIIGADTAAFNGTFTVSGSGAYEVYLDATILGDTEYPTESTNAYAVGDKKAYANTTEVRYDFTESLGINDTYVVATAPPSTPDAGRPYARVYIKGAYNEDYITIKTARFAPTLIQDRTTTEGINGVSGGASDPVSLNPSYSTIYLDGFGNYTDDLVDINPLTTQYFKPVDCFWDTSLRYNFVNNPTFETNITGWSALGSGVLSSNTTSGYVGTKSLKVTDSSGSAGGATTTVYLPYPAVGGESVTISAYVSGARGTFSITSPDTNSFTYSGDKSFYFGADQEAVWTRIDNVVTLNQNQTNFTLNVNSVLDSGYTNYSIDAVQAEWGQTPSHFIRLSEPGAFSFPNPNQTSNTLWAAYSKNYSNGKSTYIPEWGIKFNRLFATLNNFVPAGSSWTIKTGWSNQPSADLESSLIPSSSFENDLGDWEANAATLVRVPYMGSQVDHVTHGIAYAKATTTRTVDDEQYVFGISSDKIYVNPNKGYYGSVAVRPVPGTSCEGFYGITVEAYNEDDVIIQSFNNTLRFNTDYITEGEDFTVSATAPSTPIEGDRWLEPDSGIMYTWVIDEDSSQWAEVDEYNYYVNAYGTSYTSAEVDLRYSYGPTPPAGIVGARWVNTDTQIGYTWFDDGDTQQWVEFAVVYADSSVYLDETYDPQWAYLNIVIPKGSLVTALYGVDPEVGGPEELVSASYVKFKVECNPDVFATGQSFHIDRAIFRE